MKLEKAKEKIEPCVGYILGVPITAIITFVALCCKAPHFETRGNAVAAFLFYCVISVGAGVLWPLLVFLLIITLFAYTGSFLLL
jgi:hypothetical protein